MTTFKTQIKYCIAFIIPVLIMSFVFSPLIKVGDKAPGFTLPTVNGSQVSLSNYKGKVVVIHIWSHTCPHCREFDKTLPSIVAPYLKSNLTYIMIDIDTDTTGWRKVIKEDKLNFAIHASDPHDGAAQTAVDYDLEGTPCVNIADEKGNLIGVNITSSQLSKILKKRFPKVK